MKKHAAIEDANRRSRRNRRGKLQQQQPGLSTLQNPVESTRQAMRKENLVPNLVPNRVTPKRRWNRDTGKAHTCPCVHHYSAHAYCCVHSVAASHAHVSTPHRHIRGASLFTCSQHKGCGVHSSWLEVTEKCIATFSTCLRGNATQPCEHSLALNEGLRALRASIELDGLYTFSTVRRTSSL